MLTLRFRSGAADPVGINSPVPKTSHVATLKPASSSALISYFGVPSALNRPDLPDSSIQTTTCLFHVFGCRKTIGSCSLYFFSWIVSPK